MDPDLEQLALLRALLRYFESHPFCCDSVQGMARWWFPQGTPVDMNKLLSCLRWLREKELIEELVAADGRIRHRRTGTDAQFAAARRRLDQERCLW